MFLRGFLFLSLVVAVGCSSSHKQSEPANDNGYSGHGSGSISPELVKQYAPPALPFEVSRRIQSILDLRTPGAGLISNDGSQLFFSWRVTGTSQIWKLNGPQKFPLQLTGGSDQTSISGITPNGRWLLISRDRNGEENPGLYLQLLDGGRLTEIQHKEKVQTHLQWIDDDSDVVYFTANDITPDSYAIYRYSIKNKKKDLMFSEPGIWEIADKRDDGTFLLSKATGSLTREIYLFDWGTKKLTPVLGQNEKAEYEVMFSPRNEEFFVLTNKFGDFKRLYRYAKGKFSPISSDRKFDVSSFKVDRPRTKIALEWNEGGYTRLQFLDASSFKELNFPKFEKADHVRLAGTSHNGRYSTLAVETARTQRTSYVYDWQAGKLTQWVIPSAPEVNTSTFAVAQLEEYTARDGTKIPMFVRRPTNCNKPCPVVVHFHGGPEAQSLPGFSPLWQLFIDSGFIVVEPNVRGSDGYGKTWISSDDGAKRLKVITDIEDAALFIRKNWSHGNKEPKVGVMGWSYGGYSTLVAMSKFAGSYNAGAALVGMSDLRTFLQNTAPYRRILRISEYGDPEKDRDALRELSAVTYVDKIKDPLLIIQGVSDPRVPAGEAIQMHQLLTRKGIPSKLILFADEGHGAAKRENQVLELGHLLSFFEKHLK